MYVGQTDREITLMFADVTTALKTKGLAALLTLSVFGSVAVAHAEGDLRRDLRRDLRNPIVRQAAIGAAAGGVVSGVTDRSSILKGVGVGALTGAGTGLVDRSRTLQDRPLLRNSAKGAIIGTGASAVLDRSKTRGAVTGAAGGAGYHLLKKYWYDDNR
jgi:hypothetical protein